MTTAPRKERLVIYTAIIGDKDRLHSTTGRT